jgi:hypothetical protein
MASIRRGAISCACKGGASTVEHTSNVSVQRQRPQNATGRCGEGYTAARNALGLERAKAFITFCFNDRCQVTDQRDFKLLLSVVENEFADEDHVSGRGEDGNVHTAGTSATARHSSDDLDVGVSVTPILHSICFQCL